MDRTYFNLVPNIIGLEPKGVIVGIATGLFSKFPETKVDLLDGDRAAAAVGDERVSDLQPGEGPRLANDADKSPDQKIKDCSLN